MWTVKQVSRITGVSVRTLHHYDAIGLLRPAKVTDAGYRLYDDAALRRLQNILLFRELQFPLREIKAILDSPNFDPAAALEQQIQLLEMQRQGKANATVIKVYTILNGLFKMAYLSDTIDRNPMDKVPRPRPRKDEIKPQVPEAYTPGEVRAILEALAGEPVKWQALIRLLIDTGARRGEALGLQWEDIDFQEETVLIRRNLCYTPDKGVYLDVPKNGRSRVVDLGEGEE